MVLDKSISIETAYETIVSKLKAFFKDCGKTKAVLGLSGGIDSALVAALAVDALGAKNVHGVLMPSQFSSLHSVSDSIDLANNLEISTHLIPIDKIYNLMTFEMHNFLEKNKWSVAKENLQARIRGDILMAYSNRFDALLLNTSNKSELFAGYGTLYGDLCGAIMVIADLYKTQVFELSEFINKKAGHTVIPEAIIEKEPSAELRPNQKDTDSLPSYDLLDPVLYALNEGGFSADDVISHGVSKELVERVLKLKKGSAFKLMQIPPVLTIGNHPIVPAYKCI